jgi:hypothetical protein
MTFPKTNETNFANRSRPAMMPPTETTPRPETARCPLCDSRLLDSPDECSKCDWVKKYENRSAGTGAVDLAASLLSIVPGVGHYYKGHKLMAWLYGAGALLAILWCALAATATMGLGLLMLPIYWAWVSTHAYYIEDFYRTADLQEQSIFGIEELRDVPVNHQKDSPNPGPSSKSLTGKLE